MLTNFLKITLRGFRKNKVFTVLNVLGLSIGLAAAVLIFLFVDHEMKYDQFHEEGDRIHRFTLSFKNGDQYTTTALTPHMLGPLSKDYFSGIETYQRMYYAFGSFMSIRKGENEIDITDKYTYTDPDFFNFFSFNLITGDKNKVLSQPNGIVLSQSAARQLFDEEDAVGQTVTMTYTYENSSFDMIVTGIMEDFPATSHFRYDYLMPLANMEKRAPQMSEAWGWTSQHTYYKLKEDANPSQVNRSKLDELILAHAPEWYAEWCYYETQPLLDIHLKSNLKEELAQNGDLTYTRIFLAIAIFILLIASINYMNLSTSLATRRAKEVGLKKVVGAGRNSLIVQFLGESVLMVMVSLVFALTFAQVSLPYFNALTGKELDLLNLPWSYYLTGFSLTLALGLFAGSYPAFLLSSMGTLSALRFNDFKVGSSVNLRKALVFLQFSISIMLIISTIIIFNQWEFLRSKDLGVDTEDILVVPLKTRESIEQLPLFRNEIVKHNAVISAGAASKNFEGRYDGFMMLKTPLSEETYSFPREQIDGDFLETIGAEIISGRNFSDEFGADSTRIIINEAAVRKMQLKDPIGQVIEGDGENLEIIGVVRDFHYESLHNTIVPLVFYLTERSLSQVFIKINGTNPQETIDFIKTSWQELGLTQDFEFEFLSEETARSYYAEQKFFTVFSVFSSLAIFIACLGIFGLAAFTAERRTKEIGIRKTLGASTLEILILLSSEFAKLVFYANLVAWPVAYLLMTNWLDNFAYRVPVSPLVYVLGALLALAVAIFTVSSQSLRAAATNPVKALRYE